MSATPLAQIAAALHAVRIHSASRYTWFGEPSTRLGRTVERALDPSELRLCLTGALQTELYRSFYTQGAPVPTPVDSLGPRLAERDALLLAFSSANRGKGCWEDDWTVDRTRAHRFVATKHGLTVAIDPAQCRPAIGALHDSTSDRHQVLTPKELVGMSPGYYMIVSDAQLTAAASQGLLRFYWNVTPAGRIGLVEHATTLFNRAMIPFSLKVLSDAAPFTRCDSAVLYLARADVQAALPLIDALRRRLVAEMMPATPVFTFRMTAGLAFAEDPPGAESFGQNRCGLLAEGIVRAHEQGARSIEQRNERVERCFAEAGVDLRKPYLNAGSSDELAASLTLRDRTPRRRASAVSRVEPTPAAMLDAAAAVGQSLCDDALWWRRRCTWLGMASIGANTSESMVSHSYSEIGPNLYGGASGVAWFLTSLYRVTGDRRVLETARGAVECALARAETIPSQVRYGLYAGWPGVAAAAAQLGLVSEDETLVRRAAALVLRLEKFKPRRDWDLMSGLAGAIVALISVHAASGRAALLSCAEVFGERLIALADRRNGTLSWKSADRRERRNLTGFSHGVAGCATAFLELHAASGESRYLDAATRAFGYERRRFDPETATWPDYRPFAEQRWHHGSAVAAAVWCHGAGGIALSRLRAVQLREDETCKQEALVALAKTRTTLEAMQGSATVDRGLCHGLAGNADVLLYGTQVLGDEEGARRDASLLHAAAARLLEDLRASDREQGFANELRDAPGLMLGRTGIGYLLLRLVDAESPSVLLLRPEQFRERRERSPSG